MTVDPTRAAGQLEHDGSTYYFCSKGCLAKFAVDPKKYLSGGREPMAHQQVIIHPTAMSRFLRRLVSGS